METQEKPMSLLVRGTVALVLAGVAPVVAAGQQSPSTKTSLVFDRVTVIDVEGGRRVPGQRVVITGNHIQAVGDAGTIKTPPGAQVIDARGKYLMPGLWEMHVHPFRAAPDIFYPLFIASGITGMRDAYSKVPLDTLTMWWREILAGSRVGPPRQLLAGSARLYAFGLKDAEGPPPSTKEEAERIIDSLKAAGANFIKTNFTFISAAAARRAGLRFGGHVNAGPTAIQASDSGISIMDHLVAAGLDSMCIPPRGSVERCGPIAKRFQQNNTWWLVDMGGPCSLALATRFREITTNFWATGTVPKENWVQGVNLSCPDSLYWSIVRRVGMPVLAGTDLDPTSVQQFLPGFTLHQILAGYVASGMTPLEALRSATLDPAKMLEGTDSLGTVARGKLADLVLLDADPLTDITNTTTIRAVVANGRYYDRAALDRVLAEVKANAKRQP